MLATYYMLRTMKRADIKKGLDRLRREVDPRFASAIRKIADNLEDILDGPSKGGNARAKNLSKKRRSEIARNAAKIRWSK
jgi:hypothetical protein